MKLPELKKRFNNKYVIRIVAGVLMVGMLGTSLSAYTVYAEKGKESTETVEESTEDATEEGSEEDSAEETLSDLLGDSVSVSEKEIGKEETVYVISDSKGVAQQTIVSDHLINNDDKDVLEDASTLKDITNVKGDETFTQNGNKLTWQADGNDIYYQGTSTEETPVTQKITYYLDGKEIEPEDLAGKSGKVTVRFDYTNNEKVGDVYVPFAAISGLILDESFSDIQVTNGKVMSDGNSNIVVGYALPGLKESLELEDGDLEDVEIPDYFEFTADVENFELDVAMTIVANAGNYIGTDGELDLSSLDDLLDTLTDATNQLTDGSAELAEGLDTLQSSMGEFSDGVSKLQSGIKAYTDGASTLASGIGSLKAGIDTLAGSTPTMVNGIGQLKSGSDSAVSGAAQIIAGYEGDGTVANPGLVNGAASVSAGVDQLASMISGMGTLLESQKAGLYAQFEQTAGMSYDNATTAIANLESAQTNLETGIGYDVQAAAYLAGGGSTSDPTYLQLTGGASQYYTAVQQALAASGINLTITNASEAAVAIDTIGDTIISLKAGQSQVDGAVAAIDTMKEKLGASNGDLTTLQAGAASVSAGVQKVYEGTKSLYAGMQTINGGLTILNNSTGTLSSGVSQLQSGAQQLADGSTALTANNDTLVKGIGTLMTGTEAIVDGVDQLDEGSHALADGIVQFNEEGIEKIVNAYNGDVKELVNRLQEVLDAGETYQSYTEVADGVNGSVKFIYKTAAVKAEE
ncbi:MAG: hypothetical protein ACI4ES_02150 [Roseburia sp.]